jgi:hypothetical protein
MTVQELIDKLNEIDPVNRHKPVKMMCACHSDDIINHSLEDSVEEFNTFVRLMQDGSSDD